LSTSSSYPEIALDTNRTENAIRPFVIGRKSWLFADTVAGAEASAQLQSKWARPACLSHAPSSAERFESLLPWSMR